MKRLLAYLKPHKWMMLLSSLLVVSLIGVESVKKGRQEGSYEKIVGLFKTA